MNKESETKPEPSFSTLEAPASLAETEISRIVLRPTKKAIAGILTLAIICIVVLEFLVYTSFLGQRLWRSAALFKNHWFTLPVYLWILIVLILFLLVLRIITQAIIVDGDGIKVRGLLRLPLSASWAEVAGIWAVVSLYRGKKPKDPVENYTDGHEAFIIMRKGFKRIASISGRFFGSEAQSQIMQRAQIKGIEIHEAERLNFKQLNQQLPGSLSFFDRRSNWFVVALVLYFLVHNVLTFVIWGL